MRGRLVLTLRTDKPEAEVGVYDGQKKLAYATWAAHRELAETIHTKIEEILNPIKNSLTSQGISNRASKLSALDGVVVYKGPGSFTGLRIGLSVANALAYGLEIPIIAVGGEDWIEQGLKQLADGGNDKIALPEYAAEAHITRQRK